MSRSLEHQPVSVDYLRRVAPLLDIELPEELGSPTLFTLIDSVVSEPDAQGTGRGHGKYMGQEFRWRVRHVGRIDVALQEILPLRGKEATNPGGISELRISRREPFVGIPVRVDFFDVPGGSVGLGREAEYTQRYSIHYIKRDLQRFGENLRAYIDALLRA